MLFPERSDNWRLGAKPAQAAFAAVAAAIAQFEPVIVGTSARQLSTARKLLPEKVHLVEIPNDDAWMRDTGPTFVVNDRGEVRGVDWGFNAWGGLYTPCEGDQRVAQRVLELAGCDRYQAPLVMEGGAFHVDGQGTLLTTEECLLNPNRNPQLSRAEIEGHLADYLNIRQIIWLGRGVYHDETSGHVDNLCCFIRPGEVVLTWTDDPVDPQYDISREAYERLKSARDAQGRELQVHKLHQPNPIYLIEEDILGIEQGEAGYQRRVGDRMAASYVNFYIANGGVIVPAFGDPHDEEARYTLQTLFPDRRVVSVPSREVLLGGGNIHCITQQQPSRV
jgi:agmatine deiminase